MMTLKDNGGDIVIDHEIFEMNDKMDYESDTKDYSDNKGDIDDDCHSEKDG